MATERIAEIEAQISQPRPEGLEVSDEHYWDGVRDGSANIAELIAALRQRDAELAKARADLKTQTELHDAQAERERLREMIESAEFREVFAAIAHEQWSGWLKYMFGLCVAIVHEGWPKTVIPDESVLRWTRQMQTLYANLSENEKASDRVEADKYLKALRAALAEQRTEETN